MQFAKLKTMGLAAVVATSVLVPIAYGAGIFQGWPIVGSASFCTSQNSQSTSNTVPGTTPSGNCTTTTPAGPTTVTGNEVIPADTGLVNQAPATVLIPMSLMTNGYGTTVTNATTGTGQAIVVADGVSNYIYIGAGTATFATLTLPPNPAPNQKFCLVNAGSGILTTTSIAVGTSGQSIVGGAAPTSIPVQVASGAQTTVTNSSVCYVYVAGATKTWYRVN